MPAYPRPPRDVCEDPGCELPATVHTVDVIEYPDGSQWPGPVEHHRCHLHPRATLVFTATGRREAIAHH